MVPRDQQEAVIRSIASSIAESNTNVSKETGVSTVVLPLQTDTPDFLQANYPTLFAVIPDLSNAVRQSLSLMKTEQIVSQTNKNAENGFNTRNAITPIADEEKLRLILPQTKQVLLLLKNQYTQSLLTHLQPRWNLRKVLIQTKQTVLYKTKFTCIPPTYRM